LPLAAELGATWWQYALLFLAVTASWAGVPFIGAAAAGAAGVAASQGNLDLAATIVVIALAGEVGGLIGYHIGSRYGRQLVEHPGKHQTYRQELLAKGERAYARWGRLAVFFTPSIVSGTAQMPYRQFVIWNFIDAIGFAVFTVGAAYGISNLVTGKTGFKDIATFIVLVAVGLLLLAIVRRQRRRLVTGRTK
jgi:membrane protein DedA with SNARE-associated domain